MNNLENGKWEGCYLEGGVIYSLGFWGFLEFVNGVWGNVNHINMVGLEGVGFLNS